MAQRSERPRTRTRRGRPSRSDPGRRGQSREPASGGGDDRAARAARRRGRQREGGHRAARAPALRSGVHGLRDAGDGWLRRDRGDPAPERRGPPHPHRGDDRPRHGGRPRAMSGRRDGRLHHQAGRPRRDRRGPAPLGTPTRRPRWKRARRRADRGPGSSANSTSSARRSGGAAGALLRKVVEAFLADTSGRLTAMRQALDRNDAAAVRPACARPARELPERGGPAHGRGRERPGACAPGGGSHGGAALDRRARGGTPMCRAGAPRPPRARAAA